LDEAADPHNGNVEADSVGRWGNSISCHAHYKLPCPLHGPPRATIHHPEGNGAGGT
jgi:hypothetical protein